jgi:hypothetical protein
MDVFIKNIKTFNHFVGKDYHTDLDKDQEYNNTLLE